MILQILIQSFGSLITAVEHGATLATGAIVLAGKVLAVDIGDDRRRNKSFNGVDSRRQNTFLCLYDIKSGILYIFNTKLGRNKFKFSVDACIKFRI